MKTRQVEIFSSTNCPYCKRAKTLLDNKGVKYIEFPIDTDPSFIDEMVSRCQRSSVPQIFIKGEHIGGFDDLKLLDDNKLLDQKLGII